MYMHQVFSVGGSHIACRRPVPESFSREDALAYAKTLATGCVIELWKDNELLASYGPELAIGTASR
jgi:hypothetical protein